ncbi:MAG: hypothetical protein KF796_01500 [Ramlibacter sp.]|nr:hypothetical protein [Ramlibacter sp.]
MTEFFQLLAKEWVVVSAAPLTFCGVAAAMFGLAYVVARWRYTALVEQAKASNETLRERLHLKAEQVEQYKDRALKFDEKVHAIVDSTSSALSTKAIDFVANIREFIRRQQAIDNSIHENEWHDMARAADQDDKKRLWDRFTAATMRAAYERNAEWDRRFKVDALMIRDELRSRLEGYTPDSMAERSYEHPTNYFGFTAVADDLEKMAKSLRLGDA